MPPKAAAEANKTFSAEVLALILAASGTTIGGKDYHIMAKLDETKTASGWEHTFRPIKARAKELKAKIDAGEFGDVAGTPKKSPAKRGEFRCSTLGGTVTDIFDSPQGDHGG